MSYPPPPLPPRYLWVPAPHAHRIRATCRRVALLLITACLVLVPLLVLFGGRLPPVHPALGVFSCALVVGSVVMILADSFVTFALAAALQGVFRALDSGPMEAWYVDTVHVTEPGADVRCSE